MTKCPYCQHDYFTHLLDGEGQCQAWLIKHESKFHEVEISPDVKAITQEVEYDIQCTCQGISNKAKQPQRLIIRMRRKGSPKDGITLYDFIDPSG
jgi:hypothetical protein